MTRIFIGIKASESLQSKISKWQEKNKKLRVRFIKPENLHITLIPPWYEENLELPKTLLPQFNFKKFNITFDEIYVNLKNKVIWVESSKPPKSIFELSRHLSSVFPKKDKREFKAHMTIARFKDNLLLENLKFKKINWKEKVSKITLFESILGRKEANYKILFQAPVL